LATARGAFLIAVIDKLKSGPMLQRLAVVSGLEPGQ
jgi:hypothetical protein